MSWRLAWLEAGACRAPERVSRGDGRWRAHRFPAGFGLLEGYGRTVLFDTGYAPRYGPLMQDTGAHRLVLRALAPVVAPSAAEVLRARGVAPEAVTDVIVSHFHTDHVGGLRDFPRACFRAHPDALRPIRAPRGVDERAGYAAAFLPEDFDVRFCPIRTPAPLPPVLAPFTAGFDVFGDSTALALGLPGHSPGQIGLFVETEEGPWLLAADAAWHVDALLDPRAAPSTLGLRLQHDARAYRATQDALRAVCARRPALTIAVSHDAPRRFGP